MTRSSLCKKDLHALNFPHLQCHLGATRLQNSFLHSPQFHSLLGKREEVYHRFFWLNDITVRSDITSKSLV